MAIVLKADDWAWAPICDCLQSIAPVCKSTPHYIWFIGHATPHHIRDLQLLVRHLDLEDQFAEVEADDPTVSDLISGMTGTTGPEFQCGQPNCVIHSWPFEAHARTVAETT